MATETIKLSRTQATAWQLLNDPQVVELLFGGGAGGGKSRLICDWVVAQCAAYPGIGVGLGRRELKRLKQTTLTTLLSETHPDLGITSADFTYNDQSGRLTYRNGSFVQLVDLAYQPSDPEYDTLGSLNLTHVVVEEGGEVRRKAYDVFGARRNRLKNKQYGLPGKLVATCNPTENFLRTEFYDPFLSHGGGTSQRWQVGRMEHKGKRLPAYRVFVRSLVHENPFIDANYRLQLERLPTPERKRLLEGDWDYAAADNLVIPPWVAQKMLIYEDLPDGPEYVALDVADEGSDQSILSHTKGGVLIAQQAIAVPKKVEAPITDLVGAALLQYCQQHEVPARNVAVDGLGVGAGVVSYCRARGFYVHRYVGGAAAPKPDTRLRDKDQQAALGFKNLRSAAYWLLGQQADHGVIKVYAKLATKDALLRELQKIEYTIDNDKVLALEAKVKLKAKLGVSPDHADSWCMAVWVQYGDLDDPRRNAKRVSWTGKQVGAYAAGSESTKDTNG